MENGYKACSKGAVKEMLARRNEVRRWVVRCRGKCSGVAGRPCGPWDVRLESCMGDPKADLRTEACMLCEKLQGCMVGLEAVRKLEG